VTGLMLSLLVMWIAILVVIVVGLVVLRRLRRQAHKRMRDDSPTCSHCGYPLEHLDVPRCPECGRVIGFDKTFADLGIDEAQVRAHLRRRRGPSRPVP
jgi:predicted RNA-binding Zn-ribbon protein involved in translation (DUF1610 family)